MFIRINRWLLVACFWLMTDLAVADSVALTDITKPIFVQPGSSLVELKLRSNPTTGYSWFLKKYDHHLLSLIKHQYVASNLKMPGAPGYDVWQFKIMPEAKIGPRLTEIKMVYARPWESTPVAPTVIKVFMNQG